MATPTPSAWARVASRARINSWAAANPSLIGWSGRGGVTPRAKSPVSGPSGANRSASRSRPRTSRRRCSEVASRPKMSLNQGQPTEASCIKRARAVLAGSPGQSLASTAGRSISAWSSGGTSPRVLNLPAISTRIPSASGTAAKATASSRWPKIAPGVVSPGLGGLRLVCSATFKKMRPRGCAGSRLRSVFQAGRAASPSHLDKLTSSWRVASACPWCLRAQNQRSSSRVQASHS